MFVTGNYHHGIIELPDEYKKLMDNAVDPKIETVMQKVWAILGVSFIGSEETGSDKALFIQGLEMAGKYGI